MQQYVSHRVTLVVGIFCSIGCIDNPKPSMCEIFDIENDAAFDASPLQFSEPAVLAIQGTLNDNQAFCSGFSIAPGLVLTAKHCLPLIEAEDLRLFDNHGLMGRVLNASPHPELDVMVLDVEWDGEEPANIALLDFELNEDWLQRRVFPAGFGRTAQYKPGVLHYYTNHITGLEPDYILVDTFAKSGACKGDSGGPLLARDAFGRLVALGVLSSSSSICAGAAVYTRLDVLQDWLPDLRPKTKACDGLDEVGYCDLDRALWCSAGVPTVALCDSNCGWNKTKGGLRCEQESACNGVSVDGICEDGIASRCIQGRVVSQDCTSCDSRCAIDPGTGVAGCASK